MKYLDVGNFIACRGARFWRTRQKLKVGAMITAFMTFGSVSMAQVFVDEDFTNFVDSITPPSGWFNVDSAANGEYWRFDNPGGLTLNNPISSPAAIFDSDFYGSGVEEEAYLISPDFDATTVDNVLLTFDHYFQGGFGGLGKVEAYDGSDWITVDSFETSTSNPAAASYDITSIVSGNDSAHVRFSWTGDYSWYWILDNVKIQNITCLPVIALNTEAVTNNSALLAWSAGGSETQ